jgi:hypothetical protein
MKRRPSAGYIDTDEGLVHVPDIQVTDGQEHPIGFLHDFIGKPKPKAKRRRVVKRPVKRKRR